MLPLMAARWYGFRRTVSGFASSSLKLSLSVAVVFTSVTGVMTVLVSWQPLLGHAIGPGRFTSTSKPSIPVRAYPRYRATVMVTAYDTEATRGRGEVDIEAYGQSLIVGLPSRYMGKMHAIKCHVSTRGVGSAGPVDNGICRSLPSVCDDGGNHVGDASHLTPASP